MQEPLKLIGNSRAIQRLREDIRAAARTDAKVLITGESGVGKEIVSRLIHAGGPRGTYPLITVNCAAITETLLESELFGHERGSFTGAYRDRVGVLEMAHRGTVFMDEIGETSPRMQSLLLRFLDPAAGRVTAAGRDLRDHRQSDVRRLVALAGQEAHLFATTIRQNLLLARPQATDGELEDVLARVRLAGWVASLPDGIDTLVGEEGSRLSGGQRQRLVLGRALLADAPVLVLDEPTAHLDAATAAALMDDVVAAAGDRALLLVTHRPEGLERMDEVVRLEGGRVVAAASA